MISSVFLSSVASGAAFGWLHSSLFGFAEELLLAPIGIALVFATVATLALGIWPSMMHAIRAKFAEGQKAAAGTWQFSLGPGAEPGVEYVCCC